MTVSPQIAVSAVLNAIRTPIIVAADERDKVACLITAANDVSIVVTIDMIDYELTIARGVEWCATFAGSRKNITLVFSPIYMFRPPETVQYLRGELVIRTVGDEIAQTNRIGVKVLTRPTSIPRDKLDSVLDLYVRCPFVSGDPLTSFLLRKTHKLTQQLAVQSVDINDLHVKLTELEHTVSIFTQTRVLRL